MTKTAVYLNEPNDFSLLEGGPFYRLIARIGLMGNTVHQAIWRILLVSLAIWLPLLLLAAWFGHALGGPGVPFIEDLAAHVRFLICTPLLLLADVINARLMKPIIRDFLDRGLIAPEDRPRFDGFITSGAIWRNSALAEGVLLTMAVAGGYYLDQRYLAMDVATWFAMPVDGHMQYTAAGLWYRFVSLIVFRFLWLRWYFRLFIWYLLPMAGVPARPVAAQPVASRPVGRVGLPVAQRICLRAGAGGLVGHDRRGPRRPDMA